MKRTQNSISYSFGYSPLDWPTIVVVDTQGFRRLRFRKIVFLLLSSFKFITSFAQLFVNYKRNVRCLSVSFSDTLLFLLSDKIDKVSNSLEINVNFRGCCCCSLFFIVAYTSVTSTKLNEMLEYNYKFRFEKKNGTDTQHTHAHEMRMISSWFLMRWVKPKPRVLSHWVRPTSFN